MLGVFIQWPWFALLPAALFFELSRRTGRRIVEIAGFAWGLYAPYEYAMKARWLCSGECNIRVDLLLIYPTLLVLSIAAVIAAVRRPRTS